jgi:hypothetical protein
MRRFSSKRMKVSTARISSALMVVPKAPMVPPWERLVTPTAMVV